MATDHWQLTVAEEGADACTLLARASGLAKTRVKEAMTKGAVWLQPRGRRRKKRLRRARHRPRPGDRLLLYYRPEILALQPPPATLVADLHRYSVWDKPAGLLTQGTMYGDHASLLRQAETRFSPRRAAWPVHRLDREASGLVVVAHDGVTAGRLSRLFADRKVEKTYLVLVHGRVEPETGVIDHPLDNRPAHTAYTTLERRGATTLLEVRITTGRTHQIRRHLAALGHPVVGDRRYGNEENGASEKSLHLAAVGLAFPCPLAGTPRSFLLADPPAWTAPSSSS